MDIHNFYGAWKLISYESRDSEGNSSYPLGNGAGGRIMYSPDGYMSSHMLRMDISGFAGRDQQKGTPEEIKTAYEGYIGYFGTYEVNQTEKIVMHYVTGSSFPNMNNSVQKRHYEFRGSRLILTAVPFWLGGEKITAVLTWEHL